MQSRSFELIYNLKAQSPMLHFQAKQQGATLRATEVKPKLDKFIIKMLGEHKIPEDWFLSGNALNYKMKFINTETVKLSSPAKIYYGNPKDTSSRDYVWALTTNCTMQILCFIPELREAIDKCINDFFICTNFGKMQSKGFGSFMVEGSKNTPVEIGRILCRDNEATACYSFNKGATVFDDIQLLYTVMKSGYNRTNHSKPRPEQYHRSYLFEYFKEKGYGNEKAALKHEKISPSVKHPDNKKVFSEAALEPYYYVRALLGVGDHIDYITDFEKRPNRQGVIGYFPVKDKQTVSINNDIVKRFASPIFFKIIGNNVYIVAKKIPDDLFNKGFVFENKQTGADTTIFTPPTPEHFNINNFLGWFVKKYNEDTKNLYGNYSIGQRINTVYQERGENANG